MSGHHRDDPGEIPDFKPFFLTRSPLCVSPGHDAAHGVVKDPGVAKTHLILVTDHLKVA